MMNREEALAYVRDWQEWSEDGSIPVKCAPKEWSWCNNRVTAILVHSVHDPITIADWEDARNGGSALMSTVTPVPNKYQRTVPSTVIDVYDVLTAYSVTNPATQHAIKKLLHPGKRGHKDTLTDLREALASIQRAIQIEEAAQ